eukprot:scaffold15386_cov57-Phaeocystis_antarctica.AAC.3
MQSWQRLTAHGSHPRHAATRWPAAWPGRPGCCTMVGPVRACTCGRLASVSRRPARTAACFVKPHEWATWAEPVSSQKKGECEGNV